MAVKKSELYSSIWASCDELRGGMDASQYKDYVLVMLFVKYISDRYVGQPYAPIKIPNGASFQDMVALKGKDTIGDDINKKIISPIAEANKLSEMPDFNNPDKLGTGKDMVNKLTNLIAIFENPALNFSSNRADGDDILGDAYEYLMRHFATESGKSKGQFYTPAEVSRIMAKVIGINSRNSTSETTVYDPTCGSGSLLLKVADEAEKLISVFGQENETSTAALGRMNMILHNNPTAVIKQGNTMSTPLFKDEQSRLKTFDYVVANPPFSFKSWSNGIIIDDEIEDGGRFHGYGVPPSKNGDYAFLLHILKSMKSKGKAAVILPHGVLFRGNAEAQIRTNLIKKGVIKGIIGLPANLFYGTGIPACLILLDKENAESRKGIFIIDAGKGFMKDGNKNRLRDQDIHKIVDVYNNQLEIPKYSRMVTVQEIAEKEYNLNIPRYIDSTEPEDIQNIEAHLHGGIPSTDLDAFQAYWEVYPSLRKQLFQPNKKAGFSDLTTSKDEIKNAIFSHPEFTSYNQKVNEVFRTWQAKNTANCMGIHADTKPKKFIHALSEDLLAAFGNLQLIDKYDMYQHIMTYWSETMQDDTYLIVADGWQAGNDVEWTKKEFEGKLIPKQILIEQYFATERKAIDTQEAERDTLMAQLEELEEEHSGEEGYFSDYDKVNRATVAARLKELSATKKTTKKQAISIAAEPEAVYGEAAVLEQYIQISDDLKEINQKIKEAKADLDKKLLAKYRALTEPEIKELIVQHKWMATLDKALQSEMQRISQRLTQRIKELAERYESTLSTLEADVKQWQGKVTQHLIKMGFA
jgi:type I restriction enzyme M protein